LILLLPKSVIFKVFVSVSIQAGPLNFHVPTKSVTLQVGTITAGISSSFLQENKAKEIAKNKNAFFVCLNVLI
jgi:hypothetical protein